MQVLGIHDRCIEERDGKEDEVCKIAFSNEADIESSHLRGIRGRNLGGKGETRKFEMLSNNRA